MREFWLGRLLVLFVGFVNHVLAEVKLPGLACFGIGTYGK